jgi:hypothetical protein
VVAPAARLGSVQPNAASPCRERTVSIALRSSVKCAARTTLERGVKVWSVNTRLNRAVTARAWSISTVQGPAPLQATLHPANAEPAPGTAVSVTDVPDEKVALQTVLHARPAGVLVTVPVPPPATLTVSPNVVDDVNVAVTVVALVGVRVHVPVPAQLPPDQPEKTEPPAGVAVRTTELPDENVAEHVVPHVIPAGALVTVPLPTPARTTVTATGAGPNAALTVVVLDNVRVQAPVPEHPPPDQPVKMEPAAGTAVSVTLVPAVKAAEQSVPQLMPAGALVTVPLPVRVTVSVTGAVEAGNS